ncbi:MAG: class I SAM-dependent methyltransferase [Candidatus Pacebacteria bacterium]|nr:class I SAM-dependent methyltransferase [Candidatus Paceibacterota bacterium]
MDRNYAKYLLEDTRKNYNLTAESYTRTRAFIPEDIKSLTGYAQKGDRVLDSGCASGRLYNILKDKGVDYYGVDISEKLIKIALKNYPKGKFQTANTLDLPFEDNFFDKILSISVIHNIPSCEYQLHYLLESKRVLKPGGVLFLRVWDFWKRKDFLPLFIRYSFLKILGKSKLDFKDVFVPWKDSQGKILINRYFHCFTKKEIENLIKKAGFMIKKSWRGGEDPRTNIYIIAEKPARL